MNRDIRFRVWNHGISKMYPVYGFNQRQIQWANEDGSLGGAFSHGKSSKKSFTILQFTGLIDSAGKDIYEGDIIKTATGKNESGYEVKWGKRECGFTLIHAKRESDDWGVYTSNIELNQPQFEIIGNIYENPELLK